MPPPKDENTGAPTAPSAIYTPIEASAQGSGRVKPQSATAKVWSVIGIPTGSGIDIC